MIEEIAGIQDRIADIQSKIASLSPGGSGLGPMIPPSPRTADGSSTRPLSFAQTLADRIRLAQPAGSPSEEAIPPASLGPLPTSAYGRKPFVAPLSLPTGPGIAPYGPALKQIVPIRSSRVDQYAPYINRYAAENGLPPALVRAVIQTESGGDPRSVSPAGAMGLMQLMPDNVEEAGISDPYDPEQNIAAGSKQLADLMSRYNGNLDLALAGYNAGPGNVHKYSGVPPFRETHNYIRRVRAAMGDG